MVARTPEDRIALSKHEAFEKPHLREKVEVLTEILDVVEDAHEVAFPGELDKGDPS